MTPLLLLLLTAGPSGEYEAMRKRIAADRVRVRFLQKEEASILRGLQGLEKAIEEKQEKVEELGVLVESIAMRLLDLDERLAQNQARLAELRQAAGRRAAAMHRLQRTSLASIVARVSDPSDARRTRDRLRKVLGYDGALIRGAKEASEEDRRLRAALEEQRGSLVSTREALNEETEASLMLKAERAALLEAIRSEKKTYVRLARELRSAAQRLEQEIGTVHGLEPAPDAVEGDFAEQKGRLPWPVPGRVEMTFGKKVDPESGMVMVSKGIDIRAPQSTPVRSVFSGRLVYAARLEGFGRTVIVDHGSSWYSIYAHLESFAAKKGQSVNQHQVVGFVGDSASTKGAYLYFELRDGRKPVDPFRWLAR